MSDNRTARDKIAKLLNMTVKNGCTEDEQETALRMAASIAAREGIDLDSCRPADAPKRKASSKFTREMKPHQTLCAQAAAILYGVECNAWNLGANGVMFVGREELIELTEQTMFWLFRQVEELYKQALPKGMSKTERGEFRKTFKAACALRTWERAQELMRDIKYNEAAAQQATGHNALVVQGYFETLRQEADDFWNARFEADRQRAQERLDRMTPEQRKEHDKAVAKAEKAASKRKGRAERQIPIGNGTRHGYAAGDLVQLRKEVK